MLAAYTVLPTVHLQQPWMPNSQTHFYGQFRLRFSFCLLSFGKLFKDILHERDLNRGSRLVGNNRCTNEPQTPTNFCQHIFFVSQNGLAYCVFLITIKRSSLQSQHTTD